MSKRPSARNKAAPQACSEERERAAALARLIAYARDEALHLNDHFLAYCLDASLEAAHETLNGVRSEEQDIVRPAHLGPDAMRLSQLH